MEQIELTEGFGDGLRLEDARGCRHSEALQRAIATGDWREVDAIAAREERRLDRAA
jgi:hypothetical protein